jgi:hypothetical protein
MISGNIFPAGANREFSKRKQGREQGSGVGRTGNSLTFHARSGSSFFPKHCRCSWAPEAPAYDAADRSAFPRASLFQAQARAAAVLVDELDTC